MFSGIIDDVLSATEKFIMPRRKKNSDELSLLPRQRSIAESGESLAKKLGVKPEGMAIALLWAPEGFAERIGIEEGNYDTDLVTGTSDLILLFTGSRLLLREFFPIAIHRLEPNGRIWICWPKTSESQKTDLTLPVIQALAESLDMIETNRCGIEEIWNGIKFKKGVVTGPSNVSAVDSIAPYSISIISSIPITPDADVE
jgi:hypothetical protein